MLSIEIQEEENENQEIEDEHFQTEYELFCQQINHNITSETFKNSNDTRWDSQRVMLRSYRINRGLYNFISIFIILYIICATIYKSQPSQLRCAEPSQLITYSWQAGKPASR